MKYYFNKFLKMPFDEAGSRVTEELKKEGFGILTEIDVKETLKETGRPRPPDRQPPGTVLEGVSGAGTGRGQP